MKRTLVIVFWASVICIALSFSLLLIFKLLHLSDPVFAYSTAILAFVGGVLLIVSSVCLSLRKDLASAWAEKLLFHLPELIVLGLVFIALAVLLFVGKMIK